MKSEIESYVFEACGSAPATYTDRELEKAYLQDH